MDEQTQPPIAERLRDRVEEDEYDTVLARIEGLERAGANDRKAALRALGTLAETEPEIVGAVLPALMGFLEDEERSVRLTTVKLFAALAETVPETVVPVVPALSERLADNEEFYYVRARSAEALGYVALEYPDEAASPEVLADLLIGLSFDEPEVKEKLAKALEHVALGRPDRLRHRVSAFAEHLDDENELVRYHLSTALVAVGCSQPEKLESVADALVARLEDENAYVRGRALEALGVLTGSKTDEPPVSKSDIAALRDDEETFVAKRARFVVCALDGDNNQENDISDEVGSLDGVCETTAGAVEEITTPDGGCPHCGLSLPENGPPLCPRCGVPY
jgi:HEAT repeat protein